jgi:hypothetical protein
MNTAGLLGQLQDDGQAVRRTQGAQQLTGVSQAGDGHPGRR